MDQPITFNGFPGEGIRFLNDLQAHNNRDWFNEYKSIYKEQLEAPAKAFAAEIALSLTHITRSPMAHKVFRIYRDVRFSKDKTPYNTHVHLSFSCADNKNKGSSSFPSFHFGLELDRIFCGCGYFNFSADQLNQYRLLVGNTGKGKILNNILSGFKPDQGYALHEPELKRVPSGFEKDHVLANLLRRKGLVLWHEQAFSDAVYKADFGQQIYQQLAAMKPVYDWLLQLSN